MYMRQKSWVHYFDRASVVHIVQMCSDFSTQNLNSAIAPLGTQTVKRDTLYVKCAYVSIYFYSYTKLSAESIFSYRTSKISYPPHVKGEQPCPSRQRPIVRHASAFQQHFEQTFAGCKHVTNNGYTHGKHETVRGNAGKLLSPPRGNYAPKIVRTISRRIISHGGGEFTKRITKASYELRRNSQPEFNWTLTTHYSGGCPVEILLPRRLSSFQFQLNSMLTPWPFVDYPPEELFLLLLFVRFVFFLSFFFLI